MKKHSLLQVFILVLVVTIGAADYGNLHNLLIKFYGYQRSGIQGNPHNPFYDRSPYPHSGDNYNGTDLSGGWYDAGDYVKFGLTTGWSAYCLLKGYDVFPRGYDDNDSWDYSGNPDGIPDILGEVKFATDYLIKAVISENTIVTDVGNAFQDHQQWVSGYQSTAARTVYTNTGADIAGLYAAALALMSNLYKEHDASYAQQCLDKAKSAFTFGLRNNKLSEQQRDPTLGVFYENNTWKDKMACGAIELYRVTQDEFYLDWAKVLQAEVPSHYYVMGTMNAGDLSAFELWRQGETGFTSSWMTDVNLALNRVVTESNASDCIKGAFINSDWGVCRDAANAAFSAALAYMVKGDSRYKDFAFQQLNWVAGMSPFNKSYVVGSNGGPTNPHHRNASTLGIQVDGGIVSGPSPNGSFDPNKPENSSWSFTDSRDIYKNTEVAIDYNAGAIGALAFMRDYLNPPEDLVRIAEGLRGTPDPADLNTGSVSITCKLEKSISWKVVLTGRNSGAKKSYTGTGSSISLTWAGESDNGTFAAGEYVDIILDISGIAPYHLSLARGSFFLSATKKEPFKATDILVDDFNDGDITNKFEGTWSAFSDKSDGGSSYTYPATLGATSFTDNGESGTKAIVVRLIGKDGADHPHAGIKSTFNPAGTAISLGSAKSIVFDVRLSSDSGTIWVELEQPTVTDQAWYAHKLKLASSNWTRIRLPLVAFEQHPWKSSSIPLDISSVSAIRFTYYGTSNLQILLDNIRIEDLDIGGAPVRVKQVAFGTLGISDVEINTSTLSYRISSPVKSGNHRIQLFGLNGRIYLNRNMESPGVSGIVQIGDITLPKGIYFLRYAFENSDFSGDAMICVQ
ncbi:MAG: hypothetical protein GF401_11735 [Chitinivibrionales bacterium]|nr:hypothetical protein [Chitinivibrionales bacterium]